MPPQREGDSRQRRDNSMKRHQLSLWNLTYFQPRRVPHPKNRKLTLPLRIHSEQFFHAETLRHDGDQTPDGRGDYKGDSLSRSRFARCTKRREHQHGRRDWHHLSDSVNRRTDVDQSLYSQPLKARKINTEECNAHRYCRTTEAI